MSVTPASSAVAVLIAHAGSRHQDINRIEAKVDGSQLGVLAVSYTLIADIDQLRMPLAGLPRHVDGLWRHSCFEAFIGMKDSAAYYEFN
ncbi:MAG: hypothetical protein ACREPG_03700, partial [Candidatus Binatia bacterium]